MRRSVNGFALLLSLLLCTARVAPAQATSSPTLPGNVVDVKAAEFFFRAPDTIPAGLTTFRLLQAGFVVERLAAGALRRDLVADKGDNTRGMHMLWVVRLDSGKSIGDLHRAAAAGERMTGWARQMGGPLFILPPATTNATIDLAPGNYALVCYVGSAHEDRSRYHLLHGMFRALTVMPSTTRWPPPAVDVVATIDPTGVVSFSKPLRAGRVVVRVDNQSNDDHELKVRLVPDGMTGAQFLAQPGVQGESAGGLSSIPPKGTVITTLDLRPGEYVIGTHTSIRHPTTRALSVTARTP